MKYPELKFQLNMKLDQEMAYQFLNHSQGGVDFWQSITNAHQDLKLVDTKSPAEQKEFISNYIADYYSKNEKKLSSALDEVVRLWAKKQTKFFQLTDQIFEKHPWPKGQYISYLSIFDCNPRFLESKTFQFYYLSYQKVSIITHEMLHFIFYDFFEENFQQKFHDFSEQKIWDLSEIFNDVILSMPEFKLLTGNAHPTFYPAHKKLLPKYQKIFQQSGNTRGFLEQII